MRGDVDPTLNGKSPKSQNRKFLSLVSAVAYAPKNVIIKKESRKGKVAQICDLKKCNKFVESKM